MSLWLREKHFDCKVKLLEFQLQELRTEIKLEKGPLPWGEYTELADLLTELRDNIARFKSENDVFLKEDCVTQYPDS